MKTDADTPEERLRLLDAEYEEIMQIRRRLEMMGRSPVTRAPKSYHEEYGWVQREQPRWAEMSGGERVGRVLLTILGVAGLLVLAFLGSLGGPR